MTTFKLPEPTGWFELNKDLGAWFLSYGYNPKAETKPLYTAQALRDVLEQAAQMCEEKHWTWRMGDTSGPKECAIAIRKMIGEIK